MDCIISFSSRKNGNCDKVAEHLSLKLSNAEVFRFSDFSVHPCGNCSYQCFEKRENCPYFDDMVYKLYDSVVKSRRAYFILPNYCDYPPAGFFIFNERSQCYFQGFPELLEEYENVPKKFIVVSNTNTENFVKALEYHTFNKPDILFLSAKKYGKVSVKGDLMTSKEAVNDLDRFISE